MKGCLVILALFSIFSGYLLKDYFIGSGTYAVGLSTSTGRNVLVYCDTIPDYIKMIPFLSICCSALLTVYAYKSGLLSDFIWRMTFKSLFSDKVLFQIAKNGALSPTQKAQLIKKRFNRHMWVMRLWHFCHDNLRASFWDTLTSGIIGGTSFGLILRNAYKGFFEFFGPVGLFLVFVKRHFRALLARFAAPSLGTYLTPLIIGFVGAFDLIYIAYSYYKPDALMDKDTPIVQATARNAQDSVDFLLQLDLLSFVDYLWCILLIISCWTAVQCFWLPQKFPIISLGYFLLTICPSLGILFYVKLNFIALVFISIYAGALVMLFLFFLMLFDFNRPFIPKPLNSFDKRAVFLFLAYLAFSLTLHLCSPITALSTVFTELVWKTSVSFLPLKSFLWNIHLPQNIYVFGYIMYKYYNPLIYGSALILWAGVFVSLIMGLEAESYSSFTARARANLLYE